MGGNSTTSWGGQEGEAAACREAKVDNEASIGGNDIIHHPKQQSTNNGGEKMRMAVCAMRGKGGGGDRGLVNDNDDEAIGGEDVCHPKQQSTNGGGKQMRMAICAMRGGGETRGGGGREVAKPPEAKASAVKRPAAEQEPEASGISG